MMRYIKIILLTLLTYCALAWVKVFYMIASSGSIVLNEPCGAILWAEFTSACILFISGLIWVIALLRRIT